MSNTNEITKEIMAIEGVTQVELAEKLGLKGQNVVAQRFHAGITIDTLYQYVTPFGYEIVVRKKDAKGKNKREFVIEK